MLDEPAYGLHYGATAAGPVFDTLAKESMRRFSIARDSDAPVETGKLIRSQPATMPTTTTTTTVPVDPAAVDPATGQPVAVDPAGGPDPAAGGPPPTAQPGAAPDG